MVRQHRTTAAVVITLALAAGFVPTAVAYPVPPNRAEAAIAAAHSSIPARPNPDEQTVGSLSRSPRLTKKQVKAIADLQRAAVQAGLHPGVFGTTSPQSATVVPAPRTSPLPIAGSTGATQESEPVQPSSSSGSDSPASAPRQPVAHGAPARSARWQPADTKLEPTQTSPPMTTRAPQQAAAAPAGSPQQVVARAGDITLARP